MHRLHWIALATSWLILSSTVAALAQPGPKDADRIRQELDRTPQADEKPFAPADGATVDVTPPAFVWLPLKKRPAGYVIAVSSSKEFPANATTLTEAPISVHVPTAPLVPGEWHWRIGCRLSDGSMAWGRSRSFAVAPAARPRPLPDIKALAAKIPQAHPRLFFPGAELERARKESQSFMGREYRGLLRSAESCLGKPLMPEPPRLEGNGPERGRQYAQIIRTTRPPMDEMETCALAYLLSGDRRFGEEAKRRLLHFFSWDPEGATSLFYNDEPAMWVMQRGIRAYDWAYDLFTPEERQRIEPVMKVRAAQFVKRLTRMPFESRPYSSHPARDVGFLGEAAMCFVHEWPEAREWLEYVLKIYWSVYPAWGEDDGGWQEGPGYWNAYMSFALHFATALDKATGVKITDKPFFRNTPYYKLYTNPPYARMSPFGDGQHAPPGAGAGYLMYHFSTLIGDPYLRWYAEAMNCGPGGGPMGFALVDPSLRARPPADLPQARVFPGVGLVAMHANLADPRNNAYLVMRSSPLGSISHGHADQNAFALEAFGEALAIASGYYPWYGSWHHDGWTRETKAVNSITLDGGQGQIKRSQAANGRIARFLIDSDYDYALGDATAAYGGRLKRFQRHVIHVRPGMFVLIDDLEASQPVAFEWWLHALEEMKIDRAAREVLVHRGDARLKASFVEPQKLTFTQTDKFDPPPENGAANQWHLTAAAERSSSALFLVVLQPHRADKLSLPSLRRTSNNGVIGVAWNDGPVEYRVLFKRSGVDAPDVQSDSPLVVLKREGRSLSWLVTEAKTLVVDHQTLLSASSPTTTAGRR
jgi:hypothetical protein